MAPAAVILPTGRAAASLTLEALGRQTREPGQTMVVGPDLTLADALRAASESDPRWVWLLDSGVVPAPTALECLRVAAARTEPPPALVVSKVVSADGTLEAASLPIPEVHRGDRVLAALDQHAVSLRVARRGSILIRRDALAESGVLRAFDRDLEWSARLLKREPGLLVPTSVVVRAEAGRRPVRAQLAAMVRLLAALEPRERLWFLAHFGEQALASWRGREDR